MDNKSLLKKKFSSDYKKYYLVDLFKKEGFIRHHCKCGNNFWSLEKRKLCPECEDYGFIEKKKPVDYLETWDKIEKFFVKNGHKSIPSYPVVCRWFPGLYFTVASIVAFQRSVFGKTVFEMPANPLIIPQSCLRFNDISNVGVTGRHLTNFTMIGQHSIYDGKRGYWKDRCIDLDYKLLTEVFKISPKDIVFLEDVWLGPAAFGYSLEYHVKGLELGNAVFTEFVGTPDKHSVMKEKVIDMGAGLERFVWFSSGTATCYDAVFPYALKKLIKNIDYDKKLFFEYSKIAGKLNVENLSAKIERENIARTLGMDNNDIEGIENLQKLYAIIDHSKSLLFAITDGALPSNVAGGYNLRIILRRALEFKDELNLKEDLYDIAEMHSEYLKKFNPRLKNAMTSVEEIFVVEEKRFKETKIRSRSIIKGIIETKEKLDVEKMKQLYESHGITKEMIIEVAKGMKVKISLPEFYDEITSKHIMHKEETNKINIDTKELPETKMLFYQDSYQDKFNAKVLKIIDKKYVILDKTCFYGRSGGQEPDEGTINNCRVDDVERIGNVIIHIVKDINFKEGDTIEGKIDMNVRKQMMQHHSATHLINGTVRKMLGVHVWQNSAFKSKEKARIDITHYRALDDDEIEVIEKDVNRIVSMGKEIRKSYFSRNDAEKRFGFGIYQGGAIPDQKLRIVEINNTDIEACSGTHCDTTEDIGEILILKTERIQDGAVRIEFVAGPAAEEEREKQEQIIKQSEEILNSPREKLIDSTKDLFEKWKKNRKEGEKIKLIDAKEKISEIEKKILHNILIEKVEGDIKEIRNISKLLAKEDRLIILFGIDKKINIFVSVGEMRNEDASEIIKEICEKIGGKGGGKKNMAQGVGENKKILEKFINEIKKKYQ